MHERAERIVTALLGDIERGVKLARLRDGESRDAQPVESFAHDRDVPPVLRLTQFECKVELPIAQSIETIKLWGTLDPSGALLVQGMEVESRERSWVNDHGEQHEERDCAEQADRRVDP